MPEFKDLRAEQIARRTEKIQTELAANKKVEKNKADLKEVQDFVNSKDAGLLIGEAAFEHQTRLKQEIDEALAKSNNEKADQLRKEKELTSSAYSNARVDTIAQTFKSVSKKRIWNQVKEDIRNFFS